MRVIRVLGWLFPLAVASLCSAMAQPASPAWGLPQLMQQLSDVRSASAQFTERKTVQMLNAPLVSSGTLIFIAPDYMRKTTLSPAPENFVLDRGQITLTGGPGNQTHHFNVRDDPLIGGLVEGIRATLAGDQAALEAYYTPRFSGSQSAWQLRLQPNDPRLAQFVRWIVISGSENRIEEIDTAGGGGISQMRIQENLGDAR